LQNTTERQHRQSPRIVECTYQISYNLGADKTPDPAARFESARNLCLQWIGRRLKRELGIRIPAPAFEGKAFEIDRHGQFYGAAPVESLNLWTARLEHDDSNVPTRTRSVDLALRRVGPGVIFILRCLCSTNSSVDAPAVPTLPRIVRDLADGLGAREVLAIDGKPWILSTESDLDGLQLALEDSGRRLPLVMLTEVNEQPRGFGVSRFVLDPAGLATDLLGLAYVCVMPRDLGFTWAARSREQVMLNAPARAPFAHHLRTQFCRLRAEAVASTVEFSM